MSAAAAVLRGSQTSFVFECAACNVTLELHVDHALIPPDSLEVPHEVCRFCAKPMRYVTPEPYVEPDCMSCEHRENRLCHHPAFRKGSMPTPFLILLRVGQKRLANCPLERGDNDA